VEKTVEERIYDWFLDELRVTGPEGEELASALQRLRSEGLMMREDRLVELFDRLGNQEPV